MMSHMGNLSCCRRESTPGPLDTSYYAPIVLPGQRAAHPRLGALLMGLALSLVLAALSMMGG